jgi:hypothetical protein
MKQHISVISIVYLLVSIFSAGVCQEGAQRATDLFPKDFVRHKDAQQPENLSGNSFAENTPIVERSNSSDFVDSNSAGAKITTSSLDELSGDDSNVVKALSVGALISIADPKHAKKHIHELNEFNTQKKVPISKVYLVGPPEKSIEVYAGLYRSGFSPNKEDQHESALLLTNQQYLPNVPDTYSGVEYSPTWIVDTEFGVILVEGEQRKLMSYFDDQGNFKLGKIKLSRE